MHRTKRSFQTIAILLLLAAPVVALAQAATSPQLKLWSFAITDYITRISDSAVIVQVPLPGNRGYITAKQFGLLRGIAVGTARDTAEKGYGRCHLIKGDYYYFALHTRPGDAAPKAGDLLYSRIARPAGVYDGPVANVAAHSIILTSVYDTAFYTQAQMLAGISKEAEARMLAAMVSDIHATGDYFLEQNADMNKQLVTGGRLKGKGVLTAMQQTETAEVTAFLQYMAARPLLYAGNTWKVSEVYATWLVSGAPVVK